MCSEKNEGCPANDTDYPSMALKDTKFSGNRARLAIGTVFAGYLEGIRFDCSDSSSNAGLEFYEEEKWKTLKRLGPEADI